MRIAIRFVAISLLILGLAVTAIAKKKADPLESASLRNPHLCDGSLLLMEINPYVEVVVIPIRLVIPAPLPC